MDAAPSLDGLDTEALKALLIERHEQYRVALSSSAQQIEHLKWMIEKLRRRLFGAKSEKIAAQLEQLELELDELETAQACNRTEDAMAVVEAAVKSRPFRKPLPEHLPREVVTHDPEQTCCPDCGGAIKQFGEDVSEQLERMPATFKVIRHVRPKFACARCERVVEAPAPARPIERGLAGPALLAHVLVSKYGNHQPLYRQAEMYAREGVDLDRSTPAGCVGASSQLLRPLVDALRASTFYRRKRFMPTTRRFRCWLPATAGRKREGCGPMCAMSARPEIQRRPQCGSPTRRIVRASTHVSI